MSCVKTFKASKELASWGKTNQTVTWYTDWMPVVGMQTAHFVLEMRGCVDLRVKAAYQLAEVRPDRPDTFVNVGSFLTADGYTYATLTLSSDSIASHHMWIRFGVTPSNQTSTSDRAFATVTLTVDVTQCGRMLGSRVMTLQALTATAMNEPITGWIPTVGVAGVQAGFVCSGSSDEQNGMKYQLVYRLAEFDPKEPEAWVAGTFTEHTASNNADEFDPNTAITTTDHAWNQFGVQYDMATNPGQTTLAVTVAAKS